MIDAVTFHQFRSFEEARLPLATLTLLVGPNASGKSNAREGIQFLSWIAQGRRLDDILRALRERELGVRGRYHDLGHRGTTLFAMAVEIDRLHWDLSIRADATGLRVAAENLVTPTELLPLYAMTRPNVGRQHDVVIAYNNFARGGKKPTIVGTDLQAVLTQLGTPAAFQREHTRSQREIPAAVERVRRALSDVVLLDPTPHTMRGESYVEDTTLSPDGSNVSSVLHALCKKKGGRDAVLAFIRTLPERDIVDLAFEVSRRQQVIVKVRETFVDGGEVRDASLLSDGTLRVLAIAAAVLSAPEGSLVVIEEIDNGVHPSRAAMLLANMHRVAKARSLRLLITSHNPALANALPAECVADVVYCYRDPKTGATALQRLGDLDDYPRLVAQGPLGELLTREVVDRFVKHPETPEEKQDAARAWLASLDEEGGA